MTTLIAVTMTSAVASEKSSEPGCRKEERKIAEKRVMPAKTVVRPALWRVRSAASRAWWRRRLRAAASRLGSVRSGTEVCAALPTLGAPLSGFREAPGE